MSTSVMLEHTRFHYKLLLKMGQSYSYFNVWAVSTIVTARADDIEKFLQSHEAAFRANHISAPVVEELDDVVDAPPEIDVVSFILKEDVFMQMLVDQHFSSSDIDILINLFRLIDNRGFREIDVRDVFICFAMFAADSILQIFELSMKITEREGTQIIDKRQLVHIFKLLNSTCQYFGDRCLQMDQIQDLADSVYTSIGRIDGTIFYPHFVEYVADHPIIEMFTSMQFQGGVRDKLLTDEQVDALIEKM